MPAAPARGEAAIAVAPPPPATGVWEPAVPALDTAAGFAWSRVEVESGCTGERASSPVPSSEARVRIARSEREFAAAYCRSSSVDWTRFRLVEFDVDGRVVDVNLARSGDGYRALVTLRSTCEASWGALAQLLLPADTLPVVVVRQPTAAPDCSEGYGY
ncbi:MAG TPA: hypothetical protein VLC09_21015 [Polyangiaceae bacterium]|nr:hypothetical protein [Polyangiaceae bacterium]